MKLAFLFVLFVGSLCVLPLVQANPDLNAPLSEETKATFDEILTPIIKIYTLVKYASTVLAALFLLYAGITYMTSGDDPRKRDAAKNIATYVVIGLVVIWAAPLLTNLLI